MARHHGKKGRVMLSPGAGAAVTVGSLTGWSLNMAGERADATAMGDANKVSLMGLPDLSGQFSGFWDDADGTLFDAAAASANGTACPLYLYPDTNDLTNYAYGSAWIDASISVKVNGPVEVSANFSAAGSWDVSRL